MATCQRGSGGEAAERWDLARPAYLRRHDDRAGCAEDDQAQVQADFRRAEPWPAGS